MQEKIDSKANSNLNLSNNPILKRKKILKKIIFFLVFLAITFTVSVPFLKIFGSTPFWLEQTWGFVFNQTDLKEDKGRTNFLLLGTGGSKHEGPNLTDTIIFLSFNKKSGKVLLLSLPRDIWVPKFGQKLNSVYALGQAEDGIGLEMTKEIVAQITGQPVHYGVVVDFSVFEKIIDMVGGIEVEVERSFDDFKYPIENGDFEASSKSGQIYKQVHFEKGLQKMDGKTALEFSRSRNSEDPLEGNDFARSKRQQKVLLALKNKLLSREVFLNFPLIKKAYQTLIKNIDTDLRKKNFSGLLRLILKYDEKKVSTLVLDEGTVEKPGFLINPPLEKYGTWTLVPRNNSWQEFQFYLKGELEKS